ncbi:hypothetical protein JHN47_46370 [Streptomyces sp. MBT62]|nr:hypothetical protein [Streptomyces sp. MBT62]
MVQAVVSVRAEHSYPVSLLTRIPRTGTLAPNQPVRGILVNKLRVAVWPLAVGLLGYCALLAFWWSGSHPSSLPGLFSFRSATWGDGLLLPLLALSLRVLTERLSRRNHVDNARRRTTCVVAVFAGAALGTAVVLSWILEDHPVLNWTLPHPHSLNAAGVWHAVFLVVASALFAALGADFVLHLRHAGVSDVRKSLTSSWACVVLASIAGYAWLGIADATRADASVGGTTSLVVLAAGLCVVLAGLLLVPGGMCLEYVNTLVTASLLTLCVLTVAVSDAHMGALTYAALLSAAGAGAGLAATTAEASHVSAVEALGVCALFGAVTVYVSSRHTGNLWITMLAPFAATAGAAALRWLRSQVTHMAHQSPFTGAYGVAAGISSCLLASSVFAAWLSQREGHEYITGGFILTIVGAVLGGVFFQYFKTDFEELIRLEADPALRSPDHEPSRAQRRAATKVWVRLASYCTAAFSAILVLTIALAPSLGWHGGSGRIEWHLLAVAGGVTALLALSLLRPLTVAASSWAYPEGDPRNVPQALQFPAWRCAGAGLLVATAATAALAYDGTFNALAVAQCVMMTLFAMESILGNGCWLHMAKLTRASRSAAATTTMAAGLVMYWSLTGLIRPHGHAAVVGRSLLAWICCVAVVFVLVEVATAAVYTAGGRAYQTDYPPVKGTAQDAFLLSILWLTLGWLPQTVLTHVPQHTNERWAAVGTILAGFMLTFCPPFLWALENNDTHVCRQRALLMPDEPPPDYGPTLSESSIARIKHLPSRITRFAEAVDNDEGVGTSRNQDGRPFMHRLSGHTAAQNAIALALVAVSVVGAAGLTSGFASGQEPPTLP